MEHPLLHRPHLPVLLDHLVHVLIQDRPQVDQGRYQLYETFLLSLSIVIFISFVLLIIFHIHFAV